MSEEPDIIEVRFTRDEIAELLAAISEADIHASTHGLTLPQERRRAAREKLEQALRA
jgi:hypothetical protein